MNSRYGNKVSSFALEGLEGRQMLSSSGWGTPLWDDKPAGTPAAVVTPLRVTPMVATSVTGVRLIDVTGNWSGTVKIAGTQIAVAGSFTITSQRNAGATGTFSLGPITANQKVVSTAIIGTDRSFKVIFAGSNFYGSINATISSNGKEIFGRWACTGPGGWKTGTFVMDLQPAKKK